MTQHDKAKGQPYDRRAVSLKSKHQCVRVAADAPTRLLLPDFRAGFTGNYTQLDSRPSQNSTQSVRLHRPTLESQIRLAATGPASRNAPKQRHLSAAALGSRRPARTLHLAGTQEALDEVTALTLWKSSLST